MEEKKFGEKLSDFFAGKGFYIVLLLCAGLIAASIGLMTDGSGTDVERRGNEDTNAVYAAESPAEARPGELPVMRLDPDAVTRPRPTVSPVPTASPTPAPPAPAPETAAAEEEDEGTITVAAASLPAVDYFIWPVNGALLRPHSTAVLGYDATMADWRTHDGVDIQAGEGDAVKTAADGTVLTVAEDELMGTTVVISHSWGYTTQYSSLKALPPVEVGETVHAGEIIGYVGSTAAAESTMGPHLHFSVSRDGERIDPGEYVG